VGGDTPVTDTTKPEVSVLMPVYNERGTVEKAL
jgi:hypothetical protein